MSNNSRCFETRQYNTSIVSFSVDFLAGDVQLITFEYVQYVRTNMNLEDVNFGLDFIAKTCICIRSSLSHCSLLL